MSCTSLTTITKACDNNIGGIVKVWLWDMEDVDSSTPDNTAWSWTQYELAHNGSPIAPTEYEFIRNSSNFTEEQPTDLVAGSTFVRATLNLVFTRREAAKSKAIKILGEGQRYLGALVLDSNNIYWVFQDLQVSNVADGSGTAKADGSKYTVTLLGETAEFARAMYDPDVSNFIATGNTEA